MTPKSEADLAVEFVRLDDLTDEEREAYEGLNRTGRVIIREKLVPGPDNRECIEPEERVGRRSRQTRLAVRCLS